MKSSIFMTPRRSRPLNNGPTACTAQELTYRAAVEAVQKGVSPKMAKARTVVKALLYGQD